MCINVPLRAVRLQFIAIKVNLTLCPRQRYPCGNVRFKGCVAIVGILDPRKTHGRYWWANLLAGSCCPILDELFGNWLET